MLAASRVGAAVVEANSLRVTHATLQKLQAVPGLLDVLLRVRGGTHVACSVVCGLVEEAALTARSSP